VGTVIQYTPRGNEDRHQRWDRLKRADLLAQYDGLHAQGVSQRQAAQMLEVPRSTLQAWRTYQENLDESPVVMAFFHSVPGLAFLHRLIMALHVVCVEIGVHTTFVQNLSVTYYTHNSLAVSEGLFCV
jgi:helix-turn-helix, Psq domain